MTKSSRFHRPLRAVLILSFILLIPSVDARDLRVGFGKAALPTDLNIPLGGYSVFGIWSHYLPRIIRDRLAIGKPIDIPEALTIVFEQEGIRTAIVALDIVVSQSELRSALIQASKSLRLNSVMFVGTHTHSGPGGYVQGALAEEMLGTYQPTMPGRLVESARSALTSAVADLAPAEVSAGEFSLALAKNRSFENGKAETSLPVLKVEFPENKERQPIVLFAYGAHPTILSKLNRHYSADYVGRARKYLADAGMRPVFLPGPMGDQKPETHYAESFKWLLLARRIQLQAQKLIEAGIEKLTPAALTEKREKTKSRFLQSLQWLLVQQAGDRMGAAVLASAEALSSFEKPKVESAERWANALRLKVYPKSDLDRPEAVAALDSFLEKCMQFQALQIGNAVIFGIPAEPSSELGDAIRKQFPGRIPFIVSNANGWNGYAVTPSAYHANKYESRRSFYGDGLAKWLVMQARAMAVQLTEKTPVRAQCAVPANRTRSQTAVLSAANW